MICSPIFTDPILQAFDLRRRRHPGEAVVVSATEEATVSDIADQAEAICRLLEKDAIAAGSLIALVVPNGPGFLAGLLAIRRASCAALLFDHRTPKTEKHRTLTALGGTAHLECRRAWPRRADDFVLTPTGVAPSPRAFAEIAVVKLTSGSTGEPRGILTPSAALVADDDALATTMGLADDERILAAIPLSHSYGLSSIAMPALMRRSVLVVPEASHPLDPMVVARSKNVTFLPTVPAYLQVLVKMASPPRPPASLRRIISAGAPLQAATAKRFREIYERGVHVFYGASECGGITYDRTGTAAERGSLGTPVDGVRLTLESDGDGDTPGDLLRGTVSVTSDAVAAGYFPVSDPALEGGVFRTRDQATFCGGELFLEGRLDDLINVRGKKVHPREVENVLAQLEGVEDVVTLGVTPAGQSEKIVRCFVACRPGELDQPTVLAWCRRHLADHKVPRSVVLLEKIPRNARGKLDRAALLALTTRET